MGNLLDTPVTEKESERKEFGDIRAGCSCMQGWRIDMEDQHLLEEIPTLPGCFMVGVFDGHGGALAAALVKKHLLEFFVKEHNTAGADAASIKGSLINSFLDLDAHLQGRPDLRNGDNSGTTAVVAVITPTHVIVANAGDSRGVMRRDGKALALSEDHKPALDRERQRIENAGGLVCNNRVDGSLAVSRAFGDFDFKGDESKANTMQKVIALPEIKVVPRGKRDEFVVLACDGIWDVMDNQRVCDMVAQALKDGEKDVAVVMEELLDQCLDLGSKDNMSALCCLLPGAKLGQGEGLRAVREERKKRAEEAKAALEA